MCNENLTAARFEAGATVKSHTLPITSENLYSEEKVLTQRIIIDVIWILNNVPSINKSIYQTYLQYLHSNGENSSCRVILLSKEEVNRKREVNMMFSEITHIYFDFEMVFLL